MSDDVVSLEELSEINTLQEKLSAASGKSLDPTGAFCRGPALYVKQSRFTGRAGGAGKLPARAGGAGNPAIAANTHII